MAKKVKGTTLQKKRPSVQIVDRRERHVHGQSVSDTLAAIRSEYYENKGKPKKAGRTKSAG